MVDHRDPTALGNALLELRARTPNLTLSQVYDQVAAGLRVPDHKADPTPLEKYPR